MRQTSTWRKGLRALTESFSQLSLSGGRVSNLTWRTFRAGEASAIEEESVDSSIEEAEESLEKPSKKKKKNFSQKFTFS